MPPEKPVAADENSSFEELYRAEYRGLLRYAEVILRNHGSRYVSASGRAEEAVQEMFAFAWEHQKELFSSGKPVGWLYKTLFYKVQEILREDRIWLKRVMQMSEQSGPAGEDFQLRAELTSLLTVEEYLLLKHLYLDGYTYSELCAASGLKKSTLAMRIKRLKERISEEYQDE